MAWVQVGLEEEPPVQQLCPDACVKLLCEESERAMTIPLNKKHAVQFASIVGHLERAGMASAVLHVHAAARCNTCVLSAARCSTVTVQQLP